MIDFFSLTSMQFVIGLCFLIFLLRSYAEKCDKMQHAFQRELYKKISEIELVNVKCAEEYENKIYSLTQELKSVHTLLHKETILYEQTVSKYKKSRYNLVYLKNMISHVLSEAEHVCNESEPEDGNPSTDRAKFDFTVNLEIPNLGPELDFGIKPFRESDEDAGDQSIP